MVDVENKWLSMKRVSTTKFKAISAIDDAARMGAFRNENREIDTSNVTQSWQAGDAEHYSEEMLDKRVQLRYHLGVTHELRRWTKAMQSHNRVTRGKPYLLSIDQELYRIVFYRISLAMTKHAKASELAETLDEDWEHDCRGKSTMSLEHFKDCLFELADVWTDAIEPYDYVDFLRKLFSACWESKGGVERLLREEEIERGFARPPGFEEEVDDEPGVRGGAATKDPVRSKFMQDAQEQARQRHEAALLLQRKAKVAQDKKEGKERARAGAFAAEAGLKDELRAQLGRNPTAAEVGAARDKGVMDQLMAELGREPTEAEMAAARERELRERMTARNGGPPTEAELAHARDVALQERLEAELGRPPDDAEIAAAQEKAMLLDLETRLGRPPTDEEIEAAREKAVEERLKGKMGRPPTQVELEAAREKAMRARLMAQNGGREPTEEEMLAARDKAMRQALKAKLGREPTEDEMEARRLVSLKLLAGGERLAGGGGAAGGGSGRRRFKAKIQMQRVAAATLAEHLHRLHMQQLRLLPSPRDAGAASEAVRAIEAARLLGVGRPASRAPVYRPRPTSRPNSRPASRPHSRPPSIRAAGAQADAPGAAREGDNTSPRRRSTAKRHMVTVGAELAAQHTKQNILPQRSRPAPDTALPGKLPGPPPPLDPARPAPDSALHLPRLPTHGSPEHANAQPPTSPRRIAAPSSRTKGLDHLEPLALSPRGPHHQQRQRQRQQQQQQPQHERGQAPVQGPASARDQPLPAERPPELGPSEIGGASRLLPSDLQRELGTAIAWHLRQTEPARFAEGARHRVRTRTLQGASPAERLLAESGLLPYAPTRARVRVRIRG